MHPLCLPEEKASSEDFVITSAFHQCVQSAAIGKPRQKASCPPQTFVIWKLVLEWQPFRNRCYTNQPETHHPVVMPDVPPVPAISCYQWTPGSWNGKWPSTVDFRLEGENHHLSVAFKVMIINSFWSFSKTISIHLERYEGLGLPTCFFHDQIVGL